jgi:hypothetical protein
MNTPSLCNEAVDWVQLLSILGESVTTSRTLPKKVNCPLCHQPQLTILQEPGRRGQWYWCSGCDSSGDMVTLASQAWSLSYRDTLIRLRKAGFNVSGDEKRIKLNIGYYNYLQRFRDMWDRARKNMRQLSPEIGTLVKRLHLKAETSHVRWDSGCGQLIGWSTALDAEQTFAPNSVTGKNGTVRSKNTKKAIFRGLKWRDVLMFQLESAPNKPSGFYFVGREGDPEKDFVVRPLSDVNKDHRCLGMYCHPDLYSTESETIFAVDDPLIAYQLQSRHLRLSSKPLPVAGYIQTPEHRVRHCWKFFDRKQIIFWSPFHPENAFSQAIPNNGLVSLTGPETTDRESMFNYLQRETAETNLAAVQQTAAAWPIALGRFICSNEDNVVSSLILNLEAAGINIRDVINSISRVARERLEQILSEHHLAAKASVGRATVVERPDGWYKQTIHGDEIVSDAVFHIEKVIYYKKTQRVHYEGHILYREKEYPFFAEKRHFDKDPLGWVHHFLLSENVGVSKYDPSWGKKALLLSQQFYDPELVQGSDHVGYEPKDESFRFPSFNINKDGSITENKHFSDKGMLPAEQFEPPRVMTPQEFEQVENVSMWELVIAALTNITAPTRDIDPSGIGILGDSWQTLVREGQDVFNSLPVAQNGKVEEAIREFWLALFQPT